MNITLKQDEENVLEVDLKACLSLPACLSVLKLYTASGLV
jgi:hypothetical protein